MRTSGCSSTERGRSGAGGGSQSATWKMSQRIDWSGAPSGRTEKVTDVTKSLFLAVEEHRLAERLRHGACPAARAVEVKQDECDGLDSRADHGERDDEPAVVDAHPACERRADAADDERDDGRHQVHARLRTAAREQRAGLCSHSKETQCTKKGARRAGPLKCHFARNREVTDVSLTKAPMVETPVNHCSHSRSPGGRRDAQPGSRASAACSCRSSSRSSEAAGSMAGGLRPSRTVSATCTIADSSSI